MTPLLRGSSRVRAARVQRNVPGQRDVEHGGPLLVGHLDQRHRAAEPGVVHRHVEAAEVLEGAVVERAAPAPRRVTSQATACDPVRRPSRPASCSAVSARRRSWASDTTTDAPSSRQRRAVAEPMPVPAAAVTMTTLPSSSPWPARGRGRGRWIEGRIWQCSRHPFRLGREAEHPLADDVALDLVGPTVNGLGAGEEKGALELAQLVAAVLGAAPPSSTVADGPSTSSASSPSRRCQLPQYSLAMEASGGATGPSTPDRLRSVL